MKLKNLTLQTHLDNLLEFYTGVLELVQVGPNAVQVGSSTLNFEPAEPGTTPFYHFAFNVPQNQLQEAKAWAEVRVPLIPDAKGEVLFHSETWDAHQFYFYDPAGNILELIARHTLPNASNEPFSSHSLLEISEIGIACPNVPAAVARLQMRTGAPLYHTQTNDSFMPLGDEHGLFIVVRQGRIWFPDTGKAAMIAPFEATLESGETITEWNL